MQRRVWAIALWLMGCVTDAGAPADEPGGDAGAAGGPDTGTGGAGALDGQPASGGEMGPDRDAPAGGRTAADAGPPPVDAAADRGPEPPDVAAGGALARDLGGSADAAPPPLPDLDADGVPDPADNCPQAPNPLQRDADADGLGDACDVGDADGDGLPDREDPCPASAVPDVDTDGDGFGNACDVCPQNADPDQRDADADGIGDLCEIPNDDDADGVPDARDNCPRRSNGAQADLDQDGVGDACDRCPADPDPGQLDSDSDGLGDGCDVCPEIAVVAQNHLDLDGDGEPTCAGDCDDTNPNRSAGSSEACDGIDNDCNRVVDDPFPSLGEPCAAGVGACRREGLFVCDGRGAMACDAVAGAPSAEVCDRLDNDCDGAADEDLVGCCEPGEMAQCGTDVGVCEAGRQVCGPDRVWGECDARGPEAEACNGADDDCDGEADENLGTITCGQGVCRRELAACAGGVPGRCVPLDVAGPERCDNALDDDCDGEVDEGCRCDVPPLTPFQARVLDAIDRGLGHFGDRIDAGAPLGRAAPLVALAFLERPRAPGRRAAPAGYTRLSAVERGYADAAIAATLATDAALSRQVTPDVYVTGASLAALAAYLASGGPDPRGIHRAGLQQGLANLLGVQSPNGWWNYGAPEGDGDLSTTQVALGGLSAASVYFPVDELVFARARAGVGTFARGGGCYSYRSSGWAGCSSSMTAAALWVARLSGSGPADIPVAGTLAWLRDNYTYEGHVAAPQAGWGNNSYTYYLWAAAKGLDASMGWRAPAPSGHDVGGVRSPEADGFPAEAQSWYYDFAYTLTAGQRADGTFPAGGNQGCWGAPDTPEGLACHAWAVLTLERSLGGACLDEDGDASEASLGADRCVPDNCPAVSNADQSDRDADGLGDACDPCPNDAN